MNSKILIFPAGMPKALEFLRQCRLEGRSAIGASSLNYDPAREKYDHWAFLPYVTDAEFDGRLQTLLQEQGIKEIYTPNLVVWEHLNKVLPTLAQDVRLINQSPVDEVLWDYRNAIAKAAKIEASPLSLASSVPMRKSLSPLQLSSLIRYTNVIPGMCDDDKIQALIGMAPHTVDGDVVEIGSWWGRSAFLLAGLARCHGIGKLLCVDPWENEHLAQDEKLVDSTSSNVNAREALQIFQIGLLPFNHGNINFLHMTSAVAAKQYGTCRSIETESFGRTDYTGRIAILHIDGNHAHAMVKADIEAWKHYVAPGGWIIFDDYVWPYGKGPKEIGDAFIERYRDNVDIAFVMGTALFLQINNAISAD